MYMNSDSVSNMNLNHFNTANKKKLNGWTIEIMTQALHPLLFQHRVVHLKPGQRRYLSCLYNFYFKNLVQFYSLNFYRFTK
jgi:hypothetical protein